MTTATARKGKTAGRSAPKRPSRHIAALNAAASEAVSKAASKTKVCSRCKRRKPLKSYNRNASHADGLQSDCRECKTAREAGYRAAKKAA